MQCPEKRGARSTGTPPGLSTLVLLCMVTRTCRIQVDFGSVARRGFFRLSRRARLRSVRRGTSCRRTFRRSRPADPPLCERPSHNPLPPGPQLALLYQSARRDPAPRAEHNRQQVGPCPAPPPAGLAGKARRPCNAEVRGAHWLRPTAGPSRRLGRSQLHRARDLAGEAVHWQGVIGAQNGSVGTEPSGGRMHHTRRWSAIRVATIA